MKKKEGSMNTHMIATLLATPGISRRTVQYALKYDAPKDITELHELLYLVKSKHGRVCIPDIAELQRASEIVSINIEKASEQGIQIIGSNDPVFPQSFRAIPDPPVILYVKGNTDLLHTLSVAVIGTRNPTAKGSKAAEWFGAFLAKEGITVVSGLALGCDTAAHKGCLNENGATVAVLAHGLDTVYPSDNYELADKIIEGDGALVSEYPLGIKPHSSRFILRDRLQSGLSSGVIVVETGIKGGTMHTVGFARQQNRLLGCYAPDYLFDNISQINGNRKLLEDGVVTPLDDLESLHDFIKQILKD